MQGKAKLTLPKLSPSNEKAANVFPHVSSAKGRQKLKPIRPVVRYLPNKIANYKKILQTITPQGDHFGSGMYGIGGSQRYSSYAPTPSYATLHQ